MPSAVASGSELAASTMRTSSISRTLALVLMRPEAESTGSCFSVLKPRSARGRSAPAPSLRAGVASKVSELGAEYDLKAIQLDLSALQQEWTNACVSSFVLRGGRQKKVRSALGPTAKEDVPQDIGRDLVVLQDLADPGC